jgi:hypothetical protein
MLVLVHRVGDAAQLAGRGFAAPHARDHRVGAVLLDVGVAALVDVAALRVVQRTSLRPGRQQVVVQRRAARRAAVGRAPAHAALHRVDGQPVLLAYRLAHARVAGVGAAAHRLHRRRPRVVAARGGHQQLLDQAGARAARGAGLGMPAHVVQREQALFLDRLADGALVTPLQPQTSSLSAMAAAREWPSWPVSPMLFAEHQPVADVGHRAALAHQLEVPAAVHRVAVQAGADELVVLDDELLVDPAPRVVEHDLFGALAAGMKLPAENRSMPVTLSLVLVVLPV